MYSKNLVLLGSRSNVTTSNPVLIADFRDLSISIQTSTGSASNISIQLTNVNGFTEVIPETAWSTVTVIGQQGIQTIDPGARWMRAIRADIAVSASSNATVTVQGKAIH